MCINPLLTPPKKRLQAETSIPHELRRLNQTCKCKLSLIVSCAVNTQPGCRYRRGEGKGVCGCKPRWLPVCLLDSKTPHGCPLWQEGKTCNCELMLMPRCLVTGCPERRRGKRCECPRTNVRICRHLRYLIEEKYRHLSVEKANRIIARIVAKLDVRKPEAYRERRKASCGEVARVGEAAVALMSRRVKRDLSPWHPDDVRWLEGNEKEERKRLEGMFRLANAIKLRSSNP